MGLTTRTFDFARLWAGLRSGATRRRRGGRAWMGWLGLRETSPIGVVSRRGRSCREVTPTRRDERRFIGAPARERTEARARHRGRGIVGSHLVDALLARGDHVLVLIISSPVRIETSSVTCERTRRKVGSRSSGTTSSNRSWWRLTRCTLAVRESHSLQV